MYLGGLESKNMNYEGDIRIRLASTIFRKLYKIWKAKMKINVYVTTVLLILLQRSKCRSMRKANQ